MKEKTGKQVTIAYGIIAFFCFVLLYGVTFQDTGKMQEKNGCDIVVLGDSIPGQVRDATSMPVLLEELTGKSVFNGALGGTCMSRTGGSDYADAVTDSLSVVSLSQAIVTQDFGEQQPIRSRESAKDYFDVTIDSLCTVDFEQVEILLIESGVNDYHAGTTIYPGQNAYDPYTYVGALRSVIRSIRETYPNVRIILVTPTYTWYREKNLTCEEYNLGGGVLEQYVEAEEAVAKEMGVEWIDLYHDFYPHENWEDWELYTKDGLHPNEAGRALIAGQIADYLKKTE